MDYDFLQILSSEIVQLIVSAICMTIGLSGIVTNAINMTVYIHQGLDSTINICFFFKSLSDLFKILFVEWANVSMNSYVNLPVSEVSLTELYYVAGGWPSGFVTRLSLYFVGYITAERCLCVHFPLSVKTMITPGRSKLVIALVTACNTLNLAPEYSSVYLSWRLNWETNRTVLGAAFRSNRPQTQGATFLFHIVLLLLGLFGVAVMTTLLTFELRRQTKWRMVGTSQVMQKPSLSRRDRKATALVIVVAAELFVYYLPLAFASLVTVFLPDFYISGRYSKLFLATWNAVYIFSMVNCSFNTIIYYRMNAKFRSTFKKLVSFQWAERA